MKLRNAYMVGSAGRY